MVERQPLADVYRDRYGDRSDLAIYVDAHAHPGILPDLTATDRFPVREDAVGYTMRRWDDTNRPHDLPGFAAHLAGTADIDMDGVDADGVLAPGVTFAYEAVRQADHPVAAIDAAYHEPVNAGDAVDVETTDRGNGQDITIARGGTVATEISTRHGDGPRQLADGWNGTNAEKLPAVLGCESQEGRLLLELHADLPTHPRAGSIPVEREYAPVHDPEGPYEVGDVTYRTGDGAAITFRMLEIDEAAYREAVDTFRGGDPALTEVGPPRITR